MLLVGMERIQLLSGWEVGGVGTCKFLKKLNTELPKAPAISFIGIRYIFFKKIASESPSKFLHSDMNIQHPSQHPQVGDVSDIQQQMNV